MCMSGSFGVSDTCRLILQAGPCCNNPIFAEIVPPSMRNMVYAFDRYAGFCPAVNTVIVCLG